MGYRTLIEINHDYISEIKRDPDGFLKVILERLHHVHSHLDRSSRPFGVSRIATRHHSTDFSINEKVDGFPANIFDDDGLIYDPRIGR